MATGFGLKPVRKIDGGELRVRPYVIPASNSTALFVGDAVILAGGMDTDQDLPTITQGTAAAVLLGAVVGFEPDPTQPYNGHYRPASTRRVVLVCDDPDAIFQVQEDAVGGAVSAANVGSSLNADIIVAAGDTVTGLSGHMLDSSDAAANDGQLKIVGILRDDTNAAAQSAGAILEVLIHEHALKTQDSIT